MSAPSRKKLTKAEQQAIFKEKCEKPSEMYQSTMIGKSLYESLRAMMDEGKIDLATALEMVAMFDKTVAKEMMENVNEINSTAVAISSSSSGPDATPVSKSSISGPVNCHVLCFLSQSEYYKRRIADTVANNESARCPDSRLRCQICRKLTSTFCVDCSSGVATTTPVFVPVCSGHSDIEGKCIRAHIERKGGGSNC